MKRKFSTIGVGVLTAIASSLCCITPLLGLLAGTSGLASTFQWIEPLRPWLIGITVLALGFAWYQQLKPKPKDDCGCEVRKTSFFQSRSFLGIVSVFSVLMFTFPSYNHIFYPNQKQEIIEKMNAEKINLIEFHVEGMTCRGCESHVEHALQALPGILEVEASFKNENTLVKADLSQIGIEGIKEVIKSINYKVGDSKILD